MKTQKKTLTLKTQIKAGDTREAGSGMATGRRQYEPLTFSTSLDG
jgi:hypothetical protein